MSDLRMKKKVLVWADSPTCSTGFATVSRNVLKVLYDTGKYDFDVVGINHGGQPHDFPYQIWPAMNPVAADKRYQVPHGFQLFVDMAGKGIYDIVFIIQDTFIVSHIMEALEKTWNKVEKKFSVVYYFPIDASPKKEWITKVVSKLHYPVAYTEYAKKEAEEHDPNLYKMPIIYHGVNKKEFFPMDKQSIKKETYKDKADKFIVLSVARNQPRKDLLRTFMGYSLFRKKHPDSFFYILAQANDVGGNLIELAANCGLEWGKDWGCPPPEYSANQGFPVSTVNLIYNSADLVVSTSHGEGFGLCVHPDTRVYAGDGLVKKISELTLGDKVLSSDGNFNQVERIIGSHHDEDIYNITTWMANTPLKASGDHRFMVYTEDGRYEWKKAMQLEEGNTLVFPRKHTASTEEELDILSFLKSDFGKYQLAGLEETEDKFRIQSRFKRPATWIPKKIKIDNDFCKIMGYYLAEGSSCVSKKDSVIFSFNKKETTEISEVESYMKKAFGLDAVFMKDVRDKDGYGGQSIKFYSSIVCMLFSKLCGMGARNKRLHPVLLNLSNENIVSLLHGYFIGDGSYSANRFEFCFSTTSIHLAYMLRFLLARLGVISSVRTSRVEYKISVSGTSRDEILRLFNMPVVELDRTHANERAGKNEDFILLPIKEITKEKYCGLMVDIQVANTNDFVAENMVVHNCNAEAMQTQTPLLVPNNTANTEIIGYNSERGYLIECGTDANLWSYHGASDNNVLRPVVDVYDMADKMCYIKEHYGEALTKAHAGFKWVPSWEDVGKEWMKVFERAEKVPDKFAYVFK